MKFQVLDIIPHLKNPVTGEIVSTADRLNQVVRTAQRAEELGYDSFSVGERHAGEFISSSPTTVLAAIAAVTSTIRLQSGVTVLSVLDPVRVAEDYATIDQLSRGRLELVIGKGNEVLQYPLFGLDLDDQWELLAEKYGLLRRLWSEENVTWSGQVPLRADRTHHHDAAPVRRSTAGLARFGHKPDLCRTGRQMGRPAVHRQRDPAAGELRGTHRALPRGIRPPRPRPETPVPWFGRRRRRGVHCGHHAGGQTPVRPGLRGADRRQKCPRQQLAVPGHRPRRRRGTRPCGQPGTGDRQDPQLPRALRPRPPVHLAAHHAAVRAATGNPGAVRARGRPGRPSRGADHLWGEGDPYAGRPRPATRKTGATDTDPDAPARVAVDHTSHRSSNVYAR